METSANLEAILQQAGDDFARGQYQLALEKFIKALESEPQNIKVLLKIGRVYCKLLKNSKEGSTDPTIYYTEALKYLNQALEIDESYIPAIAERGFVYNANKEDGLADIDFQKVISSSRENNPNWNDQDWKATNGVFFILGQQLSGQEKYKLLTTEYYAQALSSIERAIELNPDDYTYWMCKASLLGKLKRFPEAFEDYKRAFLLNPQSSEIWWYQANTLRLDKQFEEALNSYDSALEINPDIQEIHNNRIHLIQDLINKKKQVFFPAICKSWERISLLKPDNCYYWYYYGNSLIATQKFQKALDCYENAIKLNPKDRKHKEKCWYQKGRMLNFLDRSKEALDAYQKILDYDPEHIDAWNETGNILAKTGDHGEAIEAFRQALEIDNRYWRAWKSIGWAYLNFGKGYQLAIRQWKEGLKYLNSNHLEGRGALYHAIGKLYHREGLKRRGGDGKHWKNAEESYNNALSYLQKAPKLVPQYLEVLEDMYILYLSFKKVENAEETQRLEQAKEIQRIGKDTLDRLLDKSQSLDQKKKLALQFSTFDRLTVNQQIQSGEVISALETAEKGKNACLTWILSGWTKEPKTSTWKEMQGLMPDDGTAIVYWHLSPVAITTFVLRKNYDRPILVGESEEISQSIQKVEKFEAWVKEWDKLYNRYQSNDDDRVDWKSELPGLMEDLDKNILDIKAILPEIKGVRRLILIPHRDLHRFPVHALFPRHLTISYLPSIYLGLQSKEKLFSLSGKSLIVENPSGDLLYSEIECSSINQILFDLSPTVKARNKVTKNLIVDRLKSQYTLFHFSGHGKYNSREPQESALTLWNDKLTVTDILQLSLSQYHLVTLSACETAVTDKQSITEEYVGLVSAFLYQKVGYIVSTLWTVKDESSFLLMTYFYWQLKKGKQPADALARASRFLRRFTNARLKRVYEAILSQLPRSQNPLRTFLRHKVSEMEGMSPTDLKIKPFDDPYCFSSFTITGK